MTCMCEVLGIARASYYKWKNRTVPQKESKDRELEDGSLHNCNQGSVYISHVYQQVVWGSSID